MLFDYSQVDLKTAFSWKLSRSPSPLDSLCIHQPYRFLRRRTILLRLGGRQDASLAWKLFVATGRCWKLCSTAACLLQMVAGSCSDHQAVDTTSMGNKTCMVLRYDQIPLRTAAVAILLLLLKPAVKQVKCDAPKSEVHTFFYTLDQNHDGQLEQSEVERYVEASVGGKDYQTQQQLDRAAQEVIGKLDGGDVGTTISEAELERHLHRILQVRHH